MFEPFILGAVQGIAEWIPVSSEAMIILVKSNFFQNGLSFSELISFAIFLHLGTLLAAVMYFYKKIWSILQNVVHYQKLKPLEQEEIRFITIVTGVSGIVGIVLLEIVARYESFFTNESSINLFVSMFLVITAGLLFMNEQRKDSIAPVRLNFRRALITGVFQGFAAIPGISRSGSTIAAMGLLGIDKVRTLELSFILSIPLILMANIILNIDMFQDLNQGHAIALASSFVFGILTIDILLRIIQKVRLSFFIFFFALLLASISFL